MSRVILGMSGGVDSSVAAYLLKQAGHEVIGATMQTWESNEFIPGEVCVRDAAGISGLLGIQHTVIDYHTIFRHRVMQYFAGEYASGRTPNPCVICNRFVKWEALAAAAEAYQAEYVATGHYAGIVKLRNGRYALKKAADTQKDQTYALYNLSQEQLSKTILPLGQYTKETIREIAGRLKLPVAEKPDSQENCFIPDGDYAGFICRYLDKDFPEGNFIDTSGRVLGKHKGIIHYTIGQRKGLGIAYGTPLFVIRILAETNEVVLGTEKETWQDGLTAKNINYVAASSFTEGKVYTAKIRYNHPGTDCTVTAAPDGSIKCQFHTPVRAAAPGQAVVLYEEDSLAGGGTIV